MQKLLDFDVAIEPRDAGYRTRVLTSPAGEAVVDFEFPFSEQDIEILILRVLGSVGRVRRNARRIETQERRLLEDFGSRLFQAAFSGPVRDCLSRSRLAAENKGAGLRVRLRLPGTLANVPWEYLYDGDHGFLSLSPETALVRYLEMTTPARPFPISPPLRILAMIAAPSDAAGLSGQEEWAKLNSALGALEERGMVEIDRSETGALTALQRPLRLREYHVLHFVGHGVYDEDAQDGALALEGAAGRTRLVTGRDLGQMIRGHRSLRLVVLNACEGARSASEDPFGGVAQALVRQGVPAVIAMQFEISDPAAVVFSQAFYEAIADGMPVDVAMVEARRAMFAEGHEVEWATPVLYLRSPDGRIFSRGKPESGRGAARREVAQAVPASVESAPFRAAADGDAPSGESLEREALEAAEAGETLRLAGRTDEALAALDRAVALQPDLSSAIASRAETKRIMGRFDDAVADFSRAIELNPDYAWAFSGRAHAYRALESYDLSKADFDHAIELQPDLAGAFGGRAEVFRLLDRYEEALADFSRAIELDGGYVWAIGSRGQTLKAMGRYDEALADFSRALALDPDLAWAIDDRGETYRLLERYEEAVADFSRAIGLDPDYAWAVGRRGQSYAALGRDDAALADFNRALALSPDVTWVLVERAEKYRLLGRNEEALADFGRAIELSPEYAWAIASRGQTYSAMNLHEEALADFSRALALNPDLAWAIDERGETYRHLGRYEEAVADFSQAIGLDPDYAWALGRRGQSYAALGRNEEALADLGRALEASPDLGWVLDERAAIYLAMGRYSEAVADLDRSIELQPSFAWALASRGRAYRALRRYRKALADFDSAIAIDPELRWAVTERDETRALAARN
jgi:tetratricopeptide (TPR) repeat protein